MLEIIKLILCTLFKRIHVFINELVLKVYGLIVIILIFILLYLSKFYKSIVEIILYIIKLLYYLFIILFKLLVAILIYFFILLYCSMRFLYSEILGLDKKGYRLITSVVLLFILFAPTFYYILLDLEDKTDPTSFIAFIISICITMLFFLLVFWCVLYIAALAFSFIKFIYQLIQAIISKFYNFISYDEFSRVKFIFIPLFNFLPYVFKSIYNFKVKGSGYNFACYLLLLLSRFSVFLFKDIISIVIKAILLDILKHLECIFLPFITLFVLFFLVFRNLLHLLFKDIILLLLFVRSLNIYILIFGHFEGYVYRFWIYHLKDRFSYLLTCCEPIYSMDKDENKVGLFLVIFNVISIVIVLICLFYSSVIYVVTIGLHMDVCFRFILLRCDSISFVPVIILTSFSLIYIVSILFFISCLFVSIILLVRLYNCIIILFNKSCEYFLMIQSSYFYFKDYLIKGVEKVDNTYIKNCWDKTDDLFKYEHLFFNKIFDIQEDRLDKEEEKKDPNKFYYKKLFINLVAILSFLFVFTIMFISYVYF